MQADSIYIYIIKWRKITVHLHRLPSTRKSTAQGRCQEEFLHMHCSHATLCHWVISSMECMKLSGNKTGSFVLNCFLTGEEGIRLSPWIKQLFSRNSGVVEAFSKQPYFYVCIKIEREGKRAIFKKWIQTKERIIQRGLFDSSYPEEKSHHLE